MQDVQTKKDLRADKIPEILIVGSIDFGKNFSLNSDSDGLTCELSILCDKDSWKENSLNANEKQRETNFKNHTKTLLSSLGKDIQRENQDVNSENQSFCILQFFDSQENFARYSR